MEKIVYSKSKWPFQDVNCIINAHFQTYTCKAYLLPSLTYDINHPLTVRRREDSVTEFKLTLLTACQANKSER